MRSEWEQSHEPTAKEWLVKYNANDCEALDIVASSLLRTCGPPQVNESNVSDMVNVESLKPQMPFSFGKKESVTPDVEFLRKAAYWDYQRDRLYFRPSGRKPKSRHALAGCNTTSMRINQVVFHDVPPECPTCKRTSTKPKATRVRILYDLWFGHFSIKRWVVKHVYQTYFCSRCERFFGLEKRFRQPLKFGWNLVAYFVYQTVQLCIPQRIVTLSMNQLFGFGLKCTTTHGLKARAAEFYRETQREIFARLVKGNLVHVDETKANVKGELAYVWVFTNLREVAYLYADSREADVLHAALAGFKGVLISDFYAAYDSLACPQQKCLTHLLRDLNDSVLDHPYDEELKDLVKRFGSLVRPMVETVDRRGLKRHFLRKHRKDADRFFKDLGKASYHSEAALKCKDRFEKNREKLFTFLDYDGIPWNNNNAEHAIKAFAALRHVMEGTSTRAGLEEYLTLLSISQTCKYMGVDFLDFLRSGDKDIHAFAERRRGNRRRKQPGPATGACAVRDQRGGAVNRLLAFLASRPGEDARRWVCALESLIAQELTGTDGAIGSRYRSRIELELSPSEEELLERLSFYLRWGDRCLPDTKPGQAFPCRISENDMADLEHLVGRIRARYQEIRFKPPFQRRNLTTS